MNRFNYCITPIKSMGFIVTLQELQYHKIPVYLTDPKTDKIYCTLNGEQWLKLVYSVKSIEFDLIHGPKETRYEPTKEDNSSKTVES